jgi:hypothetical protein
VKPGYTQAPLTGSHVVALQSGSLLAHAVVQQAPARQTPLVQTSLALCSEEAAQVPAANLG